MEDALAAGAFVQVIDVLRDEQEPVAKAFLEFGERQVCRIGLVFRESFAQEVVEVHHALGVAAERSRRADVFDVFVLPHPVVAAEGAEPRFGADTRASQYNQFLSLVHIPSI